MNQRLFAALKQGGRLVVIDHSALAGTGISAGKTLHRIDQAVVNPRTPPARLQVGHEHGGEWFGRVPDGQLAQCHEQ